MWKYKVTNKRICVFKKCGNTMDKYMKQLIRTLEMWKYQKKLIEE